MLPTGLRVLVLVGLRALASGSALPAQLRKLNAELEEMAQLGGLLDLAGLPSLPGLPEFTGDPASLHVRSVPSSVTSTLLIDLTNVEIAGNLDRGPLAEGLLSFARRMTSLSRPSWVAVERSL